MSETIGISDTDLRSLLDVVDRGRCGGPGEHVPTSVLCDLVTVVACDEVTFQVMDPYRQAGSVQDVEAITHAGDDEEWDLWWPAFWEHCSYSLRSGDYVSVTRGSDALPGRTVGPHWSAYLEASPESGAHHAMVSLPPAGSTDRRLLLWRESGPDFSDRDIHLLSLLRPHLVDVFDRHQEAREGTPDLTARQREILRLVADGLTNGQIARRLGLADATVRKHLENTYARLGVTSRTAAVTSARRFDRAI